MKKTLFVMHIAHSIMYFMQKKTFKIILILFLDIGLLAPLIYSSTMF